MTVGGREILGQPSLDHHRSRWNPAKFADTAMATMAAPVRVRRCCCRRLYCLPPLLGRPACRRLLPSSAGPHPPRRPLPTGPPLPLPRPAGGRRSRPRGRRLRAAASWTELVPSIPSSLHRATLMAGMREAAGLGESHTWGCGWRLTGAVPEGCGGGIGEVIGRRRGCGRRRKRS
jgi:hypothetical protein